MTEGSASASKRGRRVSGALPRLGARRRARLTIRRVPDRAGSRHGRVGRPIPSRISWRCRRRRITSIGETKAVETQRGSRPSARGWALFPNDVPGTAAPATSRSPRNRERMVLRLILGVRVTRACACASNMTIRGLDRGVFFSSRTRVLSTLIGLFRGARRAEVL